MVDKSKNIADYIKKNEDAIINSKLTVEEIAEKFGVTKQLIYFYAKKVSEGLFQRREEQLDIYLKQIYRDIKEGIPLDIIMQQTYAKPFLTEVGKKNIHRTKDLILNRMKLKGIVPKDEPINRYALTNVKLKNYVNILQIEQVLKEKDVNKAKLAREIGVAHHKILIINRNIKQSPFRELPKHPQEVYNLLKRNIKIASDYITLGKKKEVYNKYKDINKHVLRLVIDGYSPFITKKLIINRGADND
ncbi:hypothetical protein [Staphylococcus pettenkoferi]|uniref:hypothetical protein n=1 Tax=Staphylococcus pettenkoferi TaxID=170573 RepID=UPI0025522971|nr:hypothetical protein [Staphylococcus pettenkoferi]MDK7284281.1 hypothetical protein [Staphylococcus pettenkoferi]